MWRGLSTRHVREGLEGHIELELLRDALAADQPQWYLERLRDRKTLLVYARYDLTFPVDLSEDLVRAFRENRISLTTSRFSAAAITAPASRRSSSSMDGC